MQALISLVYAASKRVPAVNYAFGLAGIAACSAIISVVLKFSGLAESSRAAIVVLSLTFLGSVMLLLFSRLAASQDPALHSAGRFFVWVVVAFFSCFMLLTATAFMSGFPALWAEFLGISRSTETENCNSRVQVMWLQLHNPSIQTSDVERTANEVQSCNPFQAASVKGTLAFYAGRYYDAVVEFERAHRLRSSDDPIRRNLADAYAEVGRFADAMNVLQGVDRKDVLWNYKMARLAYYDGDLSKALAMVEMVPSDLLDDGNLPGKARILQASILVDKAKSRPVEQRVSEIALAKQEFMKGYALSESEWSKVLRLSGRTRHEGFQRQSATLAPYLNDWLTR